MTRYTRLVLVLAAVGLTLPSTLAAQDDEESPPLTAPSFHALRASSDIRIDGILDEPAWAEATPIPIQWEWFPGDNLEPPVATEAFITYDNRNVYVAWLAHDPDPSQIRANLMDRDSINTFVQDDHVTLMIDFFNDERRAFQFRINPLGVQADAIFSQVEFVEDFSWDIIWDSAGKINAEGYVVEVAIPLNQIRFPKTDGEQTWGVELGRSYPRTVRHRMSANPRDRDNNCVLCQINKVTGFEGLQPGLNLELDPTLTGTRTDRLDGYPDGNLENDVQEADPGITGRWGITPSLTLNATINPDFSQVEADAIQLDVNQRFALFYEERRPFFLEGIDFFTTPVDAVFTRTVANPDWGLKLSGKAGRNGGGVFVTRDTVNNLLIPSNQGSAFASVDQDVDGGVFRYRRDIGANSTLGVLYTGREADDYHNRVGGLDGFFRLSPTNEVRFQYLRSDTLYPESIASAFDQPFRSFDGDAIFAEYQHNSRKWIGAVSYEDYDPLFRADFGFVPRVDFRTAEGEITRRFWGEPDDWYTEWRLGFQYERTEDHSGQLTDEELDLQATLLGPYQSIGQVSVERNTTFFGGTLYDDLWRAEAYFEIQPGPVGLFSLYLDYGDGVDFDNNQPADELVLNPFVELKLGRHVNAQLLHIYQSLDVAKGRLSTANLTQLRLVYNFNVRAFIRAVVQYRSVERDPDLFTYPVDPKTETLFSQLLFSYKVNPLTVIFVGYSDNYLGFSDINLTQTDRTLFIKLGYAWIL